MVNSAEPIVAACDPTLRWQQSPVLPSFCLSSQRIFGVTQAVIDTAASNNETFVIGSDLQRNRNDLWTLMRLVSRDACAPPMRPLNPILLVRNRMRRRADARLWYNRAVSVAQSVLVSAQKSKAINVYRMVHNGTLVPWEVAADDPSREQLEEPTGNEDDPQEEESDDTDEQGAAYPPYNPNIRVLSADSLMVATSTGAAASHREHAADATPREEPAGLISAYVPEYLNRPLPPLPLVRSGTTSTHSIPSTGPPDYRSSWSGNFAEEDWHAEESVIIGGDAPRVPPTRQYSYNPVWL